MKRRCLFVLAAVVLPGLAFANATGIAVVGSQGCNACHSGGVAPTVTVTPSAAQVGGGGTVTLTVTVTTPNGTRAGFNLDASNGTFTDPGPGVHLLGGNATHSAPKQEDASGIVTFTVDWVAPASGNVTFTAWGNSVNSNGANTGDRSASATTSVAVCTPMNWFADADGDTFGDASSVVSACSAPVGFVANNLDCDDSDSAVHPNALEVCDNIDNDCDGSADQGIGTVFYADLDLDGFGDPASTVMACAMPNGFVANGDDCDDTRASTHPGAAEVCDFADNDCDGSIDEGLPTQLWFVDADGDGVGSGAGTPACAQPAGHVADDGDCDDGDAQVSPLLAEVCDGKDTNCDGNIDEGLPTQTWFEDMDGDGVGGATTVVACAQPAGFVALGGDCNDLDATVKPGHVELCDHKDNDCDGNIDEGALLTFFADADGDTFGNPAMTQTACEAPAGFVANGDDCDDGRGDVHPGAVETCDDVDEDCDGVADNGVPLATCGHGICQRQGTSCHASSCTPGLSQIETCNGLDDDCNGFADDDADALCPGSEVCTAQTDGGALCAPPSEQPDAGTGGDAGVGGDGGTGGGDGEPAGCGCSAEGGSGFGWMMGLALWVLAMSTRPRRVALLARRRERQAR